MASDLTEMDLGDSAHTLQTEIKASPEAEEPALKVCRVDGKKRTVKAAVRGRRKIRFGVKRRKKRKRPSVERQRAEFVDKYWQLDKLGQGSFGFVFAGFRREDCLPVAIKHVEVEPPLKPVCLHGKELPAEVAIMLKLAAEKNDSAGMSAPIELLDWYDLGDELILVLERPFHSMDLHKYLIDKGPLQESKAKILMRQLVDAAIGLEKRQIFQYDLKLENILIDIGSSVPGVRLIDFGTSEIVEKETIFTIFRGTEEHIPPEWYIQSFITPGPSTVWQLGIVLFEMLHEDDFTTEEFLKKTLKMSTKITKNCYNFLQLCLKEDPALRSTLTELQHHLWLRLPAPPDPDPIHCQDSASCCEDASL